MATLPKPEPMASFLYSDSVVSPQYHCGKCGAQGVKLWREYQTFLNHQSLLCAVCACEEQNASQQVHGHGKTFSVEQKANGKVCVTTTYCKERDPKLFAIFNGVDRGGDQIGWRIPAVPTEDGTTYWGYTSVPTEGVIWWERLSLHKE